MGCEVTSEEHNTLKKAFQLYDVDNDGTIATNDFGKILKSLNIATEPKDIESIVTGVDINADGAIDFDEFVKAMVKLMPTSTSSPPSYINQASTKDRPSAQNRASRRQVSVHEEDVLMACFKAFDKDNDGQISKYELKEIMEKLGDPLPDKDYDDMIEDADENGDGFIDYDEFKKLLPSK